MLDSCIGDVRMSYRDGGTRVVYCSSVAGTENHVFERCAREQELEDRTAFE